MYHNQSSQFNSSLHIPSDNLSITSFISFLFRVVFHKLECRKFVLNWHTVSQSIIDYIEECLFVNLEAANKNGAEYFYCYDVSYDRLNVPVCLFSLSSIILQFNSYCIHSFLQANMPLAGRECCCNGDFCNRIEVRQRKMHFNQLFPISECEDNRYDYST